MNHDTDVHYCNACISDCKLYRYFLVREWGKGLRLGFIMLNPSTADEASDDPTIRRCVSFARREGFSGIVVLNLFAFRTPYPNKLCSAADPVGPDNNTFIAQAKEFASKFVLAWGSTQFQDRIRQVVKILRDTGTELVCLGHNKDGSPKHPLYVRSDAPLVPYGGERR